MHDEKRYRLVLASQSPRRKELLSWLNIPFTIQPAAVAEDDQNTDPAELAQLLARKKGEYILDKLSRDPDYGEKIFPLVIGADTIVALGDKIFGKPLHRVEAREMLSKLSGRTHTVHTGVYLGKMDITTSNLSGTTFVCSTQVTFDEISEDCMASYLDTGDSLDKAGSYGIQGPSLTFVSGVQGSYSNVVGLPLSDLVRELKAFVGREGDMGGHWRYLFDGFAG